MRSKNSSLKTLLKIFFLVLVSPYQFANAFQELQKIVFDGEENRFELEPPFTLRFIDPTLSHEIDVSKVKWEMPPSALFNTGYQHYIGWSLSHLSNPTGKPKSIIIYFQKATSDIEVFALKNGQLNPIGSSTQSTVWGTEAQFTRTSAVEIVLEPFTTLTCVVKVQSVPLNGIIYLER